MNTLFIVDIYLFICGLNKESLDTRSAPRMFSESVLRSQSLKRFPRREEISAFVPLWIGIGGNEHLKPKVFVR